MVMQLQSELESTKSMLYERDEDLENVNRELKITNHILRDLQKRAALEGLDDGWQVDFLLKENKYLLNQLNYYRNIYIDQKNKKKTK